MGSFIDYYPIAGEKKVTKSHWIRFLAALIKVAGSDGLSAAEQKAVVASQKALGLPDGALRKAKGLSKASFGVLLGGATTLKVVAPYLVRDVARVSDSDGQISRREKVVLRQFAAELGLKAKQVKGIVESVRLFNRAQAKWQAALSEK